MTIETSKVDEPAPAPPNEDVPVITDADRRVDKSVTRAMRMVGPPDSAGQRGAT